MTVRGCFVTGWMENLVQVALGTHGYVQLSSACVLLLEIEVCCSLGWVSPGTPVGVAPLSSLHMVEVWDSTNKWRRGDNHRAMSKVHPRGAPQGAACGACAKTTHFSAKYRAAQPGGSALQSIPIPASVCWARICRKAPQTHSCRWWCADQGLGLVFLVESVKLWGYTSTGCLLLGFDFVSFCMVGGSEVYPERRRDFDQFQMWAGFFSIFKEKGIFSSPWGFLSPLLICPGYFENHGRVLERLGIDPWWLTRKLNKDEVFAFEEKWKKSWFVENKVLRRALHEAKTNGQSSSWAHRHVFAPVASRLASPILRAQIWVQIFYFYWRIDFMAALSE